MADLDNHLKSAQLLRSGDAKAIRHLEQAIAAGKHWYIALLEAVGLWTSAEEDHDGCTYRYLINGEAFDWLLLAGRLCKEVDGLLPGDEKTALLLYGKPPLNLSIEEFKKLIGSRKYHQYLNYFYGITVEQSLILAVQEEVRKERWNSGCNSEYNIIDEVYQRIYEVSQSLLLKHFRREKKYPQRRSIGLTELKEFTYWLFKYRLKHCDKARVASDTKKALGYLRQQRRFNSFVEE